MKNYIGLPEPAKLNECSSGYLDVFRSCAALLVLLSHLRALYFVEYGQVVPANSTLLSKAFYTSSRFGHQAVMIFFVLSGFLISSSVLRRIHENRWSWLEYAVDRAARLYAVLIPGLVLGGALDWLGLRSFNSTHLYSSTTVPFGANIPILGLSFHVFIGNLLFLQTRFVPVLGSNGPLWSLFNEFWYYVLFPCIPCVLTNLAKYRLRAAFVCILLSVATLWVLNTQTKGFVVWLLGCVVSLMLRYASLSRRKEESQRALIFYVCAASSTFCLSLRYWNADLIVGLSFAAVMYGVLQLRVPLGPRLLKTFGSWAGFSYSLYILHFPLLFFVRAVCLKHTLWQPDARHLAYALIIASCTLCYSFAISRVTEAYTPKLRVWLRRRLRLVRTGNNDDAGEAMSTMPILACLRPIGTQTRSSDSLPVSK